MRLLLKKLVASLVVIRGRRRIGKSRLSQEFGKDLNTFTFSGLPPTELLSAEMQREDFARQLSRELGIPVPKSEDWGDLFWHLADRTQKGRVVIILDEISWLGNRDPTFLGKLKNAWDLHFTKNPQLILILTGSASYWIEKNILGHTGFLGRISLDLVLKELPLKACNRFWEHHKVSAYEKFKVLAVTGGIPRYLEEVLPSLTAEENIKRLCFQSSGFLFNEFDKIFSDLFSRKSDKYKEIVSKLASGSMELTSLYKALNIPKTGVLTTYLEDLEKSGFISRDYTWKIKDGKASKFSQFRLSDNYLRFYIKFVLPYRRQIEHASFQLPAYHSVLGLQFENLVLNHREELWDAMGLCSRDIVADNPFFQRSTQRKKGCQIDYLIQTLHGTLYVVEIKFSKKSLGKGLIEEVREKMHRLSIPKHFSLRPVLIHVNGVNDSITDSRFFSHIIDFKHLL